MIHISYRSFEAEVAKKPTLQAAKKPRPEVAATLLDSHSPLRSICSPQAKFG